MLVRLTPEMKRLVDTQRLGFVATVNEDGSPNLSPKGTTSVWSDTEIVFADIASPNTIANLRREPRVEINVVDPISRKGFRFKGTAVVHDEGPLLADGIEFFKRRGVRSPIRAVVIVAVTRAAPVVSPVYAMGADEHEVRARWIAYWDAVGPDEMGE